MKKKKVYIVMLNDVDSANNDITEFTVWSTEKKAIKQFKLVAESYKANIINEKIEQDEVSFDSENPLKKAYIVLETETSLTFYEDGYYKNNHIQIWITEKIIDGEVK